MSSERRMMMKGAPECSAFVPGGVLRRVDAAARINDIACMIYIHFIDYMQCAII